MESDTSFPAPRTAGHVLRQVACTTRRMVVAIQARRRRHRLGHGALLLAATLAAASALLAAVASAQPTATWTVDSTPPGAVILLDGAELTSTPARIQVARDGLLHEVVLLRPGHLPQVLQAVPVGPEMEVHLALVRERPHPLDGTPLLQLPPLLPEPGTAALQVDLASSLVQTVHIQPHQEHVLQARAAAGMFGGLLELGEAQRYRHAFLSQAQIVRFFETDVAADRLPLEAVELAEAAEGCALTVRLEGQAPLRYEFPAEEPEAGVLILEQAVQDLLLLAQGAQVSVSEDMLLHLLLAGLVDALEDRYARFLPPSRRDALEVELAGSVGGIGVELGVEEDGTVVVRSTVEDAPAARAGVRPGDALLAVDSTPVGLWELQAALRLLRGSPGSPVSLVVARDHRVLDPVRIQRAELSLLGCSSRLLDGGVGYLRVQSFFAADATSEVRTHLDKLLQNGAQALVMDLRDNPGGLMQAAAGIGDLFLPAGLFARTVARVPALDSVYETTDDDDPRLLDLPVAVLVDRYSASASEVLAGALQDRGRAEIVGETTYGKGSVQVVFPLEGIQSGLILTVARYELPSGRTLTGGGLTPDVAVAPDTEGEDPALEVARRVLITAGEER